MISGMQFFTMPEREKIQSDYRQPERKILL